MPGPARDEQLPDIVIERHCRCVFQPIEHDGPINEVRVKRVTKGCPLHDPDAMFDLPDGTF